MSRRRAISPPGRRPGFLATLALLCAATLAGCGDDTSEADDAATGAAQSATADGSETPERPTATETSSPAVPPGTPACAEVWQDGADLPRGYSGCEDAGELVAPDPLACSSGQRIVRYDDRFWAFPGGPVTEVQTPALLRDREYRQATVRCTA